MKFLKTLLIVAIASLFSTQIMAQSIGDYIDVIYLKNGSLIKGIIIEQVPGATLKIQTNDGSQYVYQVSEIEKYGRELKTGTYAMSAAANTPTPETPRTPKAFFSKKKGYFGEVTFLGGMAGMGLRVTNGYKFGRLGYLGIAVGFEGFRWNNDNRQPLYDDYYGGLGFLGRRGTSPFATVSLVYSGDMGRRRITPFYQVELGYGLNLNQYSDRYYETYDYATGYTISYNYQVRNMGGPMGGLAFGVKFNTQKRVNFKLALDARWQTNIADLSNSFAGYNAGSEFNLDGGLGLRFGIGF
jgi:hypothetical protein